MTVRTATTTAPAPGAAPAASDPAEADLVVCVDADGRWVAKEPFPADRAPQMLEWLDGMIRTRRLDEEATALQRQGQLGIWSPCLGQEAAQIGSASVLRPDDFAFPTYREHGVALTRGAAPVELLLHFRGVTNCGYRPTRLGLAPYAIVLGSQVLHAVGYAMGLRKRGSSAVAVAYFGDGTISQGDVNEAFVFASVYQAPVVFFCQNNQWAISEPLSRQTRVPVAQRGSGFGIPSVRVDGNDAVAVAKVTEQACERARSGGGPTLIEAYTYRMGPHTTSDDPTRYRDDAQVEAWRRRDPIARLTTLLLDQGVLTPDGLDRLKENADAEAQEARTALLSSAPPNPSAMFEDVYAEPDPSLREEARTLTAYLDSFEAAP